MQQSACASFTASNDLHLRPKHGVASKKLYCVLQPASNILSTDTTMLLLLPCMVQLAFVKPNALQDASYMVQ
jgi:hypothetical protein